MQLLLLVCLLAFGSWGVSDKLAVTQTPAVSVMEWGAANISCCWTGKFDRVSVIWLKNETKFDSEVTLSKTSGRCTVLSFMRLTREQSGTYICRVTVVIPFYGQVEGNGTVVTVIAREDPEDSGDADTGSGEIPESRGKTDDTSAGGRGRHMVIPKAREDADDTPHEETAADYNQVTTGFTSVSTHTDDPQEDVVTHIMRCLPIITLFITFCCLYYSGSKAQPHTPAAPENEPTAQTTDQDQEEEERAEKGNENERGKEENNIMSED